jgi:hypothetical protein
MVMPRSAHILLAASLLAILGGAFGIAHADVVYEWTDGKGQVHYTDQWVPGAKLVKTDSTRPQAADSSATQAIESESNAASRQIQQQDTAQAVQQDEAKARAARCAQDKTVYEKLIESRRIFTTDKSGERHYLSDADADAARLKARQDMQADCGAGS